MTKPYTPRPYQRRRATRDKPGKDGPAKKTAMLRALAGMMQGTSGYDAAYRLDQFASTLERSVWLFSAVYRIANVLASTKLRVVESGTNKEAKGKAADALRKLLRRINAEDTSYDFKQAVFVHISLDGEWMAEKARDGLGRVAELHIMKPQFTRLMPDSSGRRRVGSFVNWESGSEITLPRSEVVYCKVYNPANTYRGIAPTAPLKRELDWDLRAQQFNRSLIDEGMRTGGIMMPREGYTPSEAEWEQLKVDLRAQNAGTRNAGRLLMLNAPFDFKPDGIAPSDMEMMAGRKLVRDMAGSVTGASPMMMMNFDAASYANAEAQVRQFWDHVGKPMLTQTFAAITEQLVEPDFGEDLEVLPDMAGIDAQIDSEMSRVETTSKLLLGGIISLNEARDRMGKDPVEGGEAHFVQGAIVPMLPGEFENPLAQASNNRQQPDMDGGGPGGAENPQAPRRSPTAPGPAKGIALAEAFGEATGLLERLRADAVLWRTEFVEGATPPHEMLPRGLSRDALRACSKTLGRLAGCRVDLQNLVARDAVAKCHRLVLAQRVEDLHDALGLEQVDAGRMARLDPFSAAMAVWVKMVPILVEAAEELHG